MTCLAVIPGLTLTSSASSRPVSWLAVIWQQASPPAADHAAAGGLSWLWTLAKPASALTLLSASVNVVWPTTMPRKQGGAQVSDPVTRLVSSRYLSDFNGGGGPHAETST